VQQTYAAAILPKVRRPGPDQYFGVISSVGGDFAAESCANPDSTAATTIFNSEKIPVRADYTVLKV
jgi:hypothetical protein